MNEQPTDEQRRLAALAESTLKFRRSTQDAIDKATIEAVLKQHDISAAEYRTPGGRPAMVVLCIGEDAVNLVKTRINDPVIEYEIPDEDDEQSDD